MDKDKLLDWLTFDGLKNSKEIESLIFAIKAGQFDSKEEKTAEFWQTEAMNQKYLKEQAENTLLQAQANVKLWREKGVEEYRWKKQVKQNWADLKKLLEE